MAVELYVSLYHDPQDLEPTKGQKQSRQTMIEGVWRVLAETHKSAAEEVPMSDEGHLAQMEEDERFQREVEAEEEERMVEEEIEAWLKEARARVRAQRDLETQQTATAGTATHMYSQPF